MRPQVRRMLLSMIRMQMPKNSPSLQINRYPDMIEDLLMKILQFLIFQFLYYRLC